MHCQARLNRNSDIRAGSSPVSHLTSCPAITTTLTTRSASLQYFSPTARLPSRLMSSEIPRHSRALYSPAGEYPSSNQPTPPPQTRPRWSRTHSIASNSSRRRRSKLSSAKRNAKRVHKWARRKLGAMTMAQKILGGMLLAIGLVMGILMLVFHKQILHELMEPAAVKLRYGVPFSCGNLLVLQQVEESSEEAMMRRYR